MARKIKRWTFIILFLTGTAIALLFLLPRKKLHLPYILQEEIHNLVTLNSIEHYYQFVFPFDFLPDKDTMTILYSGQEAPHNTDPAAIQAYNIARLVGFIHPYGDPSFVVLTTIIRAGISFKTQPIINITDNSITIILEKAKILFVELKDIEKNYSYPPIKLDARSWKEISTYVRKQAINYAKDKLILQQAEKHIEKSLSAILKQLGFSTITITFR